MTTVRCKTVWATPRSGTIAHMMRGASACVDREKIFYKAHWFCGAISSQDVVLLPEEHGLKVCQGCLDGADGPTLYRCWNAAGELLYIGIAKARRRRMAQHTRDPWWPSVADVTFENFPLIEHALVAERMAIRAEQPLHNRMYRKTT
jgi:hypothetical protein